MSARADRALALAAAALLAAVTVVSATGGSATATPAGPRARTASTAAATPDAAWQLSYLGSGASQLNSVAAISPRNAWAAGYYGKLYYPTKALVLHWNGTKWSSVRVPDPRALRAAGVAASSAHDVWLFGGNNKILRWNGHKWLRVPSLVPVSESQPSYAPAQGAVVLSESDVWLLGGIDSAGNGQVSTPVSHWNGRRWRTWTVRGIAGSGLSALSATDVWLAGRKRMGLKEPVTAARFTGRSWRPVAMRHPDTYYYQPAVVMASASDVWIGTDQVAGGQGGLTRPALILHWRAGRWTQSQPGPLTANAQSGFVTDGAGGVFDSACADWTSRSWVAAAVGASMQDYDACNLDDLARIPGSTQLWGVGATPGGSGPESALIASYN